MKKNSVISILLFLFIFFTACAKEEPITPTVLPSAQPLLETMSAIAKTVEVIGGTATAYAFTPTPTSTPTRIPDPTEVSKTISNAIKDKLITTFGASITVEEVKFGPIGAEEYTYLYIEIQCAGNDQAACPTSHVIIAVMDACKDRRKKILENVPSSTEMLTMTIFDPMNSPQVVEINWSDVLDYIKGKLSGGDLNGRITYIRY